MSIENRVEQVEYRVGINTSHINYVIILAPLVRFLVIFDENWLINKTVEISKNKGYLLEIII